jgi:hypothetical protein
MLKEEYLGRLLHAIYARECLNVYDYAAAEFTTSGEIFAHTKSWTDQLTRDKLAVYTDAEHTTMQLTNFGKFWILKGGYDIFLKEGQIIKEHHHNHDDEHKAKLIHKEKDRVNRSAAKTYALPAGGFLVNDCYIFYRLSAFAVQPLSYYEGKKMNTAPPIAGFIKR